MIVTNNIFSSDWAAFAPADVAGVAARVQSEPAAHGGIPGDLVSWDPKPEVVARGADPAASGGLWVTHRRSHAPLPRS